MSNDDYKTFWRVAASGERVDDIKDVERLVRAGVLVYEVPEDQQAQTADARNQAEAQCARGKEQARSLAANAAYEDSPDGKAAAVRRAAQGEASHVTGERNLAHEELDQYSARATNVFESE